MATTSASLDHALPGATAAIALADLGYRAGNGEGTVAEGVIDKQPSSKTAMKSVQSAFNTWMNQSGRSLTEISRVLAMSV